MDGSDGKTDLRMRMPECTGAFFRSGVKADGTVLLLGENITILLLLLLNYILSSGHKQADLMIESCLAI